MQVLTTVLYQGKRIELLLDPQQWESWRLVDGKFRVNQKTASSNELLNKAYNDFCANQLKKIIEEQTAKLRTKKIELEIPYINNSTKVQFMKKELLSVDDYLKLYGYANEIEFKIGKYEREWGINQIDANKKNFILHFNLDLIKFDSGEHIKYVVAHELTHVFYRDHGDKFQEALQRLYPNKSASESFFTFGIPALFGKQNYSFQYTILILVGLAIIYWLFNQVWGWIQSIFPNLTNGSGSNYF
ncbi:MAG: hypothetical protein OHK0017_01850 [Patescibacteria group bacterium]